MSIINGGSPLFVGRARGALIIDAIVVALDQITSLMITHDKNLINEHLKLMNSAILSVNMALKADLIPEKY